MALRPWNVFKKTIYASHAEGSTAALPLTTRLSLARAKAQTEEFSGLGTSYTERLALVFSSSAAAWLLLFAAWWRYSDVERLRNLEHKPGGAILLDLLGKRGIAHFGPFQIPNFVSARLHEQPLRRLREPLLLDSEREQALLRLEQLSLRRHALRRLPAPPEEATQKGRSSAALRVIEPLLQEAFVARGTERDVRPASQQAVVARIILDVVADADQEERAVPSWVLSGLVAARGAPWDAGPQGEELRATLLCQLLRTPANSEAAAALPTVVNYVLRGGIKRKEDTVLPVKAYLLSGETPDLLRRAARLIYKQRPDALEVPQRYVRDTPSLEMKRDLRNVWTTILVSAGWALCRAWPGIIDMRAILAMAVAMGQTLAGTGALELLWRAEEHVIQTESYYTDTRVMLLASTGMLLVRSAVWAWAFRFSTVVPFLLCRLAKDDFLDAYRTFEV